MDEMLSTTPPEAEAPRRLGRPPKDRGEKVEIDRDELQALLKRVDRLENPGIIEKVKRVTEHVGYLRGWEGKLVVGVGGMKENHEVKESDINRYQMPVELLGMDGVVTEKKVPYLFFLENSDKYSISITQMTRERREEVDTRKGGGGSGTRDAIDAEGRMTDKRTGEQVEFSVSYLDMTLKAVVTEGPFTGKELEFDNSHMTAINL